MKASKVTVDRLLKTAKGQIDAVMKMIEDDRYCLDIYNQLLAVEALIKKANEEILRSHMLSCVKDSFKEGNSDEKIDELINLLSKINK